MFDAENVVMSHIFIVIYVNLYHILLVFFVVMCYNIGIFFAEVNVCVSYRDQEALSMEGEQASKTFDNRGSKAGGKDVADERIRRAGL